MNPQYLKHRRVMRRHLCGATFGPSVIVYGGVVTLAVFLTLWIVILRCAEEYDIQHWVKNHIETGDYAVRQIEAYRNENGVVPERLECLGFKGYDSLYYIQLSRHIYGYGITYVRTGDTTYHIGFGWERYVSGEYLQNERRWRVVTHYDGDTTMVGASE